MLLLFADVLAFFQLNICAYYSLAIAKGCNRVRVHGSTFLFCTL